MGATPWQMICKVLLPEATPGTANACTILLVSLTEYSAMAGALGGGGLKNMAIQYGYYQFDTVVMLQALIALVAVVLALQFLGDFTTRRLSYHTLL
jgi:D-methionine transport system permease protein